MTEMKMCDVYPERPAVAMFQWPWTGEGSSGYCSLEGQASLNQQAKNLKRAVSYLPLPMGSQPNLLKRDERTRLIAERLSAQSEREEVAQRNTDLYTANTELSAQLKLLKLRAAEADAQLRDLRLEIQAANEEAVTQTKKASELTAKLMESEVLVQAGAGVAAEKEIASLTLELGKARQELASAKAYSERAVEDLTVELAKVRDSLAEIREEAGS